MFEGLMERLAESPQFAGFKVQLEQLVKTVQQTHQMVAHGHAITQQLRAEVAHLRHELNELKGAAK